MTVKPLLLKLVFTSLFIEAYFSYSCNKKLLNSFLLTGMKYPIYNPMKICANVKDRCCTVADEIKISKLWNERAKPMLDVHGDEVMEYTKKIVD